ncbi:hypothetical protein BCR34DRAFT_253672 [Clohesyomyces aquaticus]|uniref:Uncharacterized protein n=1 Tax=Clohesyomyces aquaticus TaxID=1231657 RepID=A0A1Y1ZUH7_9PLEO|nr:hypothetical protein BCR34DRAFT_253672 [Clohesyomyces aquaticus]
MHPVPCTRILELSTLGFFTVSIFFLHFEQILQTVYSPRFYTQNPRVFRAPPTCRKQSDCRMSRLSLALARGSLERSFRWRMPSSCIPPANVETQSCHAHTLGMRPQTQHGGSSTYRSPLSRVPTQHPWTPEACVNDLQLHCSGSGFSSASHTERQCNVSPESNTLQLFTPLLSSSMPSLLPGSRMCHFETCCTKTLTFSG